MFRFLLAVVLAFLVPLTSAKADERKRIGYGYLITNDVFGDGFDRWRTGSVASSHIWGPMWSGQLPTKFGALIELRLGAEVIAPADLRFFNGSDRRYGSSLSVGVHTHYLAKQSEVSAGLDLVFVGPQTGLSGVQDTLHDILGGPPPSDPVLQNQIANSIRPTAVVEFGRSFDLSSDLHIRPFVEGRAGAETLLRAGFDLTLGALGQGELLARDPVSGHRYRTVLQDWTGFSAVLGTDVTHVAESVFLPTSRGPRALSTRERVRLGIHWQGQQGATAFYGLTWLSEEFEGQAGGQAIGSALIRIRF